MNTQPAVAAVTTVPPPPNSQQLCAVADPCASRPHGSLTHFPHRFNCSRKPSRRIPRQPPEGYVEIRIPNESVILSRMGFPRTWQGR